MIDRIVKLFVGNIGLIYTRNITTLPRIELFTSTHPDDPVGGQIHLRRRRLLRIWSRVTDPDQRSSLKLNPNMRDSFRPTLQV